ncbi:hypothetical protein KFK09_022361 [Dendrobium nobile]|uniref:Complex III subunit VI n=1 Tax=Dendrobium nobile TaxID=94219 RepID=A0A8T3AJ77_DENNO|nr:hypothetical protein KFK09_022361 [Dendrobium nobile]
MQHRMSVHGASVFEILTQSCLKYWRRRVVANTMMLTITIKNQFHDLFSFVPSFWFAEFSILLLVASDLLKGERFKSVLIDPNIGGKSVFEIIVAGSDGDRALRVVGDLGEALCCLRYGDYSSVGCSLLLVSWYDYEKWCNQWMGLFGVVFEVYEGTNSIFNGFRMNHINVIQRVKDKILALVNVNLLTVKSFKNYYHITSSLGIGWMKPPNAFKIVYWIKPPPNVFKLNVDGSGTGCGRLICDSNDHLIIAFAGSTHNGKIDYAIGLANLYGIQLCISLNLINLLIEVNSDFNISPFRDLMRRVVNRTYSMWADEELVDPKKYLEERCKPKCVKRLFDYQACVKRIDEDETGHKHCTGQYFDFWHCIDKCVAEKLFEKLK